MAEIPQRVNEIINLIKDKDYSYKSKASELIETLQSLE